jgi:hypothetical protein
MADKKPDMLLPSPTFEVKSSGKELKMSYGMYNDIMRLIGNPEDATQLLVRDAMTRDLVIRRLFTDNNKSVEKTEELIDSYEIDIQPSELDGVVAWVADHVAYFLFSTGRMMEPVIQKYQDQMPKVEADNEVSSNPSSDGSRT